MNSVKQPQLKNWTIQKQKKGLFIRYFLGVELQIKLSLQIKIYKAFFTSIRLTQNKKLPVPLFRQRRSHNIAEYKLSKKQHLHGQTITRSGVLHYPFATNKQQSKFRSLCALAGQKAAYPDGYRESIFLSLNFLWLLSLFQDKESDN